MGVLVVVIFFSNFAPFFPSFFYKENQGSDFLVWHLGAFGRVWCLGV